MALSYPDAAFIGSILTTLFIGVYITVFGLYVKITRVRKAPLSVIDYGIIALFVLAVVAVSVDSVQQFYTLMRGGAPFTEKLNAVTSTLSLTLDFISQIILVRYRCWIVWGKQTWIGLPPAFLALASYVCGLCVTIDLATRTQAFVIKKDWWVSLGVTSMSLSLAVNAIVSSLMIARIWYVYSQTRVIETSGRGLLWVSSILLESAVVLFFAQLAYLVLYKLKHPAFALIAGPVTVIYGLNCTAIMVRVGMNHSFETQAPTQHTSLLFVDETGKVKKVGESGEMGSKTQISSRRYGNTHRNETDTTVYDRA